MMIELEREATLKRLKQEGSGVILAVEDTTSFNFTHHPATTGLGVIENNRSVGFYAHTTLAVSESGVPLGLFAQQVWRRDKSTPKIPDAHKKLPITQKESMKWLNGLYQTQGSSRQVIVIGDREADIYELFQEAQNTDTDLIIRAKSNRCLMSEGKLFEALAQQEFVATFEVEVARQVNQEKRLAQVGLRYGSVILRPPSRAKSSVVIALSPLTLQVVEVVELNAPADAEAIHWLLLTTLELNSVQDAQRVVRFYSYRWVVERFHYVLKSGCKMEQSQLQSYDALTRFLALCSHQAWQILELTYQARVSPDVPCDTLLTLEQWQALQAHQTGHYNPLAPCPTLHEACRSIAHLGGFIGRKSDGFPGVKVLWRGWQRLNDLVAMWQLFHPPPKDVGNV
jgi:hypothetical protein